MTGSIGFEHDELSLLTISLKSLVGLLKNSSLFSSVK